LDKNYTEVRDCTEWYWKYIYNNRDVQMSENAVIVVAIGKSPEWKACRPSVEKYCKKYDLPLEVVTKTKYGIEPFDTFSNSINLFEKNSIYELFEKYDRILRLDYDLIISPNCPNLFEIVPEDKIGGVYEDVGLPETDRRRRILNIQNEFGDLQWRSGYMNAGVVVASRQHRQLFNTTIYEINRVQSIRDIKTPEQDYFNYMVRKLGIEVFELDYKFNHIMWFSPNRFESYIIHYAGSNTFDGDLHLKRMEKDDKALWREVTAEQMRRDYEYIMEGKE